jgi:hypothetical protein
MGKVLVMMGVGQLLMTIIEVTWALKSRVESSLVTQQTSGLRRAFVRERGGVVVRLKRELGRAGSGLSNHHAREGNPPLPPPGPREARWLLGFVRKGAGP